MKGLLKSGKKFRVTRPVVFLPGLTDEFVLEHTKSLRMHDFNGPEMEQVNVLGAEFLTETRYHNGAHLGPIFGLIDLSPRPWTLD